MLSVYFTSYLRTNHRQLQDRLMHNCEDHRVRRILYCKPRELHQARKNIPVDDTSCNCAADERDERCDRCPVSSEITYLDPFPHFFQTLCQFLDQIHFNIE